MAACAACVGASMTVSAMQPWHGPRSLCSVVAAVMPRGAARACTAVSVRQDPKRGTLRWSLYSIRCSATTGRCNACCSEPPAWLTFTQRVTVGFFGLELLVRILGHGRYYFMFKRNAMDAAVIAYLVCAQVTCETMVRFLCAGCTSNRFWLH